jgi:hypothetical protein
VLSIKNPNCAQFPNLYITLLFFLLLTRGPETPEGF